MHFMCSGDRAVLCVLQIGCNRTPSHLGNFVRGGASCLELPTNLKDGPFLRFPPIPSVCSWRTSPRPLFLRILPGIRCRGRSDSSSLSHPPHPHVMFESGTFPCHVWNSNLVNTCMQFWRGPPAILNWVIDGETVVWREIRTISPHRIFTLHRAASRNRVYVRSAGLGGITVTTQVSCDDIGDMHCRNVASRDA
jgi:hypothetical protein